MSRAGHSVSNQLQTGQPAEHRGATGSRHALPPDLIQCCLVALAATVKLGWPCEHVRAVAGAPVAAADRAAGQWQAQLLADLCGVYRTKGAIEVADLQESGRTRMGQPSFPWPAARQTCTGGTQQCNTVGAQVRVAALTDSRPPRSPFPTGFPASAAQAAPTAPSCHPSPPSGLALHRRRRASCCQHMLTPAPACTPAWATPAIQPAIRTWEAVGIALDRSVLEHVAKLKANAPLQPAVLQPRLLAGAALDMRCTAPGRGFEQCLWVRCREHGCAGNAVLPDTPKKSNQC